MKFHRATVIALVLAVALAGCASIIDQASQEDDGATTPSPAPTGTVGTPAPTPTPTATPTPEPTPTATATWSQPATPLQPTEDKIEEGRIKDVQFVNTVEAESGGYVDFDVRVSADTRFPDVDPDSDGEPYFTVEINDRLIERTDILPFEENGTTTIRIRRAGLQQFESGTLNVRVRLMEEDSHYADLYDTWTGTIEYSGE